MALSLDALRQVLRTRQAAIAPQPPRVLPKPTLADQITEPLVLELRDLKAVLQKHHDSTPRVSPG